MPHLQRSEFDGCAKLVRVLRLVRADEEADFKDKIHERLQSRCEPDALTGCWIYTGYWKADGQATMRVGASVFKITRVAAWLYFEPAFDLHDPRMVVHKPSCPHVACCNPDHLMVAPGPWSRRQFSLQRQRLAGGEDAHETRHPSRSRRAA